jgi:protein O-GlcNAc transferase
MSDSLPDPDTLAQLKARHAELAGASGAVAERLDLSRRIAAASDTVTAWVDLAFECINAYRFGDAHAAFERAIARDPDYLPAHWGRFQFPDDLAPRTPADAVRFRQRWSEGLARFEALDFRDPRWSRYVWACIGQSTPFYLHYVCDAIAEQRRYGALLQRMMAVLDPGITRPPPPRPRRRVLFISAHLQMHTVGRLFAPLIAGLDARRFDVHAIQFGAKVDALTRDLAQHVTVHHGERLPPHWRQLIGQLAPDVIVYLDIGMDALTQGLAALRLAPRQAVMWGHPVTTGLPTIDAVLSPGAMEPPDAQSHYSERLVRLPALGHGLAAPATRPPPLVLDRRPGRGEIFCAQTIYKLMPEQDALFARILAALPEARLHLIAHQDAQVRAALGTRIGAALQAAGVDPTERLVLHPLLTPEAFVGLGRACDFALDSIGWSGGMSSLDLLGAGVPVVTLPGTTMRSRQTAALLRALDAPQLVARNTGDYVAKALELARNPARRAALGERLYGARARLHEARPVIAALEDFLAA